MNRTVADDPIMSELHAIREKHDQQTKSTPATERNRLVSFLSSYGYQLVPTKRGTRKLVRSSKCMLLIVGFLLARQNFVLAGEEQGTVKERQTHCSKLGDFSDPVPYSSHLIVHYIVATDRCYRKEPDLAPKTNTICVQKLNGAKIAPIFRIINKYNYTEDNWKQFKSSLKSQYGGAYSEVSARAVPFFSPSLKEQLRAGDVVKIPRCMDGDEVCYYFTDRESMLYYIKYHFVEDQEDIALYIDYH